MNEDKNILDKVNRHSGMTTPENYFADFAEQMMQKLPEKEEAIITKPVTTWQRIRPFVYLVAMFAGIWCMVKMVDLISTGASLQTEQSTEQIVAEAITDESFIEEYCYEDMNEYSIMESMYEEGIDTEEITNLDTEN
ncbi:MAG: hypothetical protein J6B30_08450 [Muribaculaceae bacterium]|nr:hypothetical protein [Muribaculaceae bacterium]